MTKIEKERKAFEEWAYSNKWNICRYPKSDYHMKEGQYCDEFVDGAWHGWIKSANREGYKLVPVDDINIADMIWGKCSCGSSRSPIVSDREGYNLIHCFACGANKYIHEDY